MELVRYKINVVLIQRDFEIFTSMLDLLWCHHYYHDNFQDGRRLVLVKRRQLDESLIAMVMRSTTCAIKIEGWQFE